MQARCKLLDDVDREGQIREHVKVPTWLFMWIDRPGPCRHSFSGHNTELWLTRAVTQRIFDDGFEMKLTSA